MLEKIKNFSLTENYDINFLGRIFVTSFFICFIVWSYLLFWLWWGDHDWGYIRSQLALKDGFFEARYSQHLFSVVLFNGQVLPVLVWICSIAALVLTGVLAAVYLKVPQEKGIFYIFVLFAGLNPFVVVFFYYVYLALPFMAWPLVGVVGLILCAKDKSLKRFVVGSVIWFLVLGSYPPNIALLLTLFTARQIIGYCYENEELKRIFLAYVYFGGQFLLGFAGFKLVYLLLESRSLISLDMYNIKMRSIEEIIANIPLEFGRSVGQFFNIYTFMAWDYCILLFIPVAAAFYLLYYKCNRSRVVLSLLLIGVLLCSRFAFLISPRSEVSAVRLEYFGRFGLGLFALSIIGRLRQKCSKNLFLLWGVVVLFLFAQTDFEIQKVQNFSFLAGRKYQERLVDRVVSHPNFVMEKKYIAFSFGNPNFQKHFLEGKNLLGEQIVYGLVFYHDVIKMLFWENMDEPVAIGTGINGKTILRVDHSDGGPYWLNSDYWQNNPENMSNMRYWLYMEAKQNGVYVDDRYIILVLDILNFYKNREFVVTKLDE